MEPHRRFLVLARGWCFYSQGWPYLQSGRLVCCPGIGFRVQVLVFKIRGIRSCGRGWMGLQNMIKVILGLYRGHIRIMERKMETTGTIGI